MSKLHVVNDPLFGPRYTSRGERVVMRLRRLWSRYKAAVKAPEPAAQRFEAEAW